MDRLPASQQEPISVAVFFLITSKYSFSAAHENKIEQVLFVNNEQSKQNIFFSDYVENINNKQNLIDLSNINNPQTEDDNKFSEQMEKVNEINKKLNKTNLQHNLYINFLNK